jgi:hypothetical protein
MTRDEATCKAAVLRIDNKVYDASKIRRVALDAAVLFAGPVEPGYKGSKGINAAKRYIRENGHMLSCVAGRRGEKPGVLLVRAKHNEEQDARAQAEAAAKAKAAAEA